MKTASLDIPHSAADRSKSWRCVGCGALSPNRLRSCECPTEVVRGPHGLTDWKVEPYDNAVSEQVARWMISNGYATGHGETVEDMLTDLESQAKERGKRAALAEQPDPTPPDQYDVLGNPLGHVDTPRPPDATAQQEAIAHDWIRSTLGHGEVMCSRCLITNREAAVLGDLNECKPRAGGHNTLYLNEVGVIARAARAITGED